MNDARFRRVTLAACLAWAAVALVVLALAPGAGAAVINILNAAMCGVAAGACLVRAAREPNAAAGWRTIAAGTGVLGAYQLYPLVARATLGGLPPFPGAADWLSLLDIPLYAVGMLLWPIVPRSRAVRVRTALDGVMFGAAILFLIWIAGLGELVRSSDLTAASRVLAAGQFAAPTAALGIVLYLVEPSPRRLGGPIGWLAASLLVFTGFNLPVSVLSLQGRYYLGHPLDVLLLLGLVLLALASLSPRAVRDPVWRDNVVRPVVAPLLLPYLPALLVLLVATWRVARPGRAGDAVLAWLGMIVGSLVLLRQYIALRDVERLSEALRAKAAEQARQLELSRAALAQAQSMEAAGRMAGGVAHDFNNLVHAITSWAAVLGETLRGAPRAETAVREIQEAGERARAMASRLLTFARGQAVAPRTLDLGQLVQEAAPILQHVAGDGIRLELRVLAGGAVFADRAQLEQLLSALTSRARDAMSDGGKLVIAVEPVDLPPAAGNPGGPQVRLAMTDDGEPRRESIRAPASAPIADPDAGDAGLLLATCDAIVSGAGGRIQVVRRAGYGTTVLVDLPRAH